MLFARLSPWSCLLLVACAHQAAAPPTADHQPPVPPSVDLGVVDLSAFRRLDMAAFVAPESNHYDVFPTRHHVQRRLPDGRYAYASVPDLSVVAEMPAPCVPAEDALLFECGDAVRDSTGQVVHEGPRIGADGFLTRAVVEGGRWVAFGPRTWTVHDPNGPVGDVPAPRATDVAGRRLVVTRHYVQYQGPDDTWMLDTSTMRVDRVPHGTPYMRDVGGAMRGEGVLRAADGSTTSWRVIDAGGTTTDAVNHAERTWRCPRELTSRPCLQVVASHTGEILVMQRDARSRLDIWRTDGTRFGAVEGLHPSTTVTLSHDGRYLLMPVSGGIEIANLDTLRPTLLLAGHRNGTVRFDTLPGHDRLISCDGAGMAVLWNRTEQAPMRHLGFPGCEGLAYARDGSRFIAGHTVFDADGRTLMTLPKANATTLALDGMHAFTLAVVEGATFDDRRVVLQAFSTTTMSAPIWSVVLPQRRLLDPGVAMVVDADNRHHLVVGTGDVLLVVNPIDGSIVRRLSGASPSAPMALWDRSGVAVALGTAGNRVQLITISADDWRQRKVADWNLVDNVLPLHVPALSADGAWVLPTAGELRFIHGRQTISVAFSASPADTSAPVRHPSATNAAVSAVPLDAGAWLVGHANGTLSIARPATP
jgi:hypothetical protein